MAGQALLFEAEAHTGSGVETLRAATHNLITAPTDIPANATYLARLRQSGSINRSLFNGGGTLGQASVNYGFVELINQDGLLDPWLNYAFDGRPFRLRRLPNADRPVHTAETIFRGTCQGIDGTDPLGFFRLRLRDRLAELAAPLLTARYAGTTTSAGPTAEGTEDLRDTLKPRVWGRCFNVSGVLVNPFNLLYQFSAGPVADLTVYDGGIAIPSIGDYPELASLVNVTVPAGFCATCRAQGLVRMGALPAKAVTADVTEGAALSDRSAAAVALRMLYHLGKSAADVDLASVTATATFNPAEVGILVNSEATALDAIGQALSSVGAGIVPTAAGLFQMVGLAAPSGEPVRTYTARDLLASRSMQIHAGPADEGDGVPAWSVALTYARNWTPQGPGELNGDATIAADPVGGVTRRAFLQEATRKATAQDASVKAVHLLAPELSFDTLLVNAADAQAEAARRLALYSIRRDVLSWPVPAQDGQIELGGVVRITLPRFGFNAGKLFRVVGRADDYAADIVTLRLWG